MKKSNKSSIIFTTMSVILAILVLLAILTGMDNDGEALAKGNSRTKANTTNAEQYTMYTRRLKAEEIFETFETTTASLDYKCPREESKCIATVEVDDNGVKPTTYDVYLYNYDGVIGTWIVNQAGVPIDFYGKAYIKYSNHQLCLGNYYERSDLSHAKEPDTFVRPIEASYIIVT